MLEIIVILFQSIWEFVKLNSQVLSNIAIVGAFITTIVTYRKTFNQNKKDEQIKISIDISKQLTNSENNFKKIIDEIKFSIITEKQRIDKKQRVQNRKAIEPYIVDHFNNWEWFALLVNKKYITDRQIKEHFRDKFCEEYQSILSKFPNLDFNEVHNLYKKWKN